MKIAYAGFDMLSPAIEALYENGCEIVKIFSNKVDNVTEFNTSITDFAQKHDIPITFDKITLDDLKQLKESGVDALICAAYYYRVPILQNFKMINIHPSVLPLGRGAWPTAYAILNDIKHLGVTFHKMEEGFDTGDIILQKSFEISSGETHKTLMRKIHTLLPSMIKELLADFSALYDNAKKQEIGEYWDCPDEKDYVITSDTPFEKADKILRAFYGFFTVYKDGNISYRLLNAKAVKGDNSNEKFKIKDGYIESEVFEWL